MAARLMTLRAASRWPNNSSSAAAEPRPAVPKCSGSSRRWVNHTGIAVAPMSTPVYVARKTPENAVPTTSAATRKCSRLVQIPAGSRCQP